MPGGANRIVREGLTRSASARSTFASIREQYDVQENVATANQEKRMAPYLPYPAEAKKWPNMLRGTNAIDQTSAKQPAGNSPKVLSRKELRTAYQKKPQGGVGRPANKKKSRPLSAPQRRRSPTPTVVEPFKLQTEKRYPVKPSPPEFKLREQRGAEEVMLSASGRRPCCKGPARTKLILHLPALLTEEQFAEQLADFLKVTRDFIAVDFFIAPNRPDRPAVVHVDVRHIQGRRAVERIRWLVAVSDKNDGGLRSILAGSMLYGPFPVPDTVYPWVIQGIADVLEKRPSTQCISSSEFSVCGMDGFSLSFYPFGVPESSCLGGPAFTLQKSSGTCVLPFSYYLSVGGRWRGPFSQADRRGQCRVGDACFFSDGSAGLERAVSIDGALLINLEVVLPKLQKTRHSHLASPDVDMSYSMQHPTEDALHPVVDTAHWETTTPTHDTYAQCELLTAADASAVKCIGIASATQCDIGRPTNDSHAQCEPSVNADGIETTDELNICAEVTSESRPDGPSRFHLPEGHNEHIMLHLHDEGRSDSDPSLVETIASDLEYMKVVLVEAVPTARQPNLEASNLNARTEHEMDSCTSDANNAMLSAAMANMVLSPSVEAKITERNMEATDAGGQKTAGDHDVDIEDKDREEGPSRVETSEDSSEQMYIANVDIEEKNLEERPSRAKTNEDGSEHVHDVDASDDDELSLVETVGSDMESVKGLLTRAAPFSRRSSQRRFTGSTHEMESCASGAENVMLDIFPGAASSSRRPSKRRHSGSAKPGLHIEIGSQHASTDMESCTSEADNGMLSAAVADIVPRRAQSRPKGSGSADPGLHIEVGSQNASMDHELESCTSEADHGMLSALVVSMVPPRASSLPGGSDAADPGLHIEVGSQKASTDHELEPCASEADHGMLNAAVATESAVSMLSPIAESKMSRHDVEAMYDDSVDENENS